VSAFLGGYDYVSILLQMYKSSIVEQEMIASVTIPAEKTNQKLVPEIPLKKHERLVPFILTKLSKIFCMYNLDALKNQ
jgi:hypothetical protein